MIHVVTPFSRAENVPVLLRHLAGRRVALTWHPLVSTVPFPAERPWIEPLQVDVPAGDDPFCFKLRAFVGSGAIVDGERYCVLCDDDMYDEGVLAAVDGMSERIVVVSMLRGQRTPERAAGFPHPTSTLWAEPSAMHACGVGLQQCFVMGELFRQIDFRLDQAAYCDGLAAEWLAANYADEIRYEPELFVLFNRLEPGRWAVDWEERSEKREVGIRN